MGPWRKASQTEPLTLEKWALPRCRCLEGPLPRDTARSSLLLLVVSLQSSLLVETDKAPVSKCVTCILLISSTASLSRIQRGGSELGDRCFLAGTLDL